VLIPRCEEIDFAFDLFWFIKAFLATQWEVGFYRRTKPSSTTTRNFKASFRNAFTTVFSRDSETFLKAAWKWASIVNTHSSLSRYGSSTSMKQLRTFFQEGFHFNFLIVLRSLLEFFPLESSLTFHDTGGQTTEETWQSSQVDRHR
jgi:hypothetical protein